MINIPNLHTLFKKKNENISSFYTGILEPVLNDISKSTTLVWIPKVVLEPEINVVVLKHIKCITLL